MGRIRGILATVSGTAVSGLAVSSPALMGAGAIVGAGVIVGDSGAVEAYVEAPGRGTSSLVVEVTARESMARRVGTTGGRGRRDVEVEAGIWGRGDSTRPLVLLAKEAVA